MSQYFFFIFHTSLWYHKYTEILQQGIIQILRDAKTSYRYYTPLKAHIRVCIRGLQYINVQKF